MSNQFEQHVDSSYIRKYLRYTAAVDGVSLAEAGKRSLKRIKAHVNNPDIHILVMSAFRHDWDKGDLLNNYRICKAKNTNLKQDFKYFGWGYFPVVGGWVEDGVAVDEDSFFVVVRKAANDLFLNTLLGLVKKYRQDAALYRLAGEKDAYGLLNSGARRRYGTWKEDNLATYYTRLRGSSNIGLHLELHAKSRAADNKKGNRKLEPRQRHKQKFTFEGVGTESRMANQQAHYYDRAVERGATRPLVASAEFDKGIRPN